MPKLSRVREYVFKNDIDAFLITNLTNVRYVSGFTGTNGQVLITRERAYFLTDFRYKLQAPMEVYEGYEIVVYDSFMDSLKQIILKENVSKLGFEANHVSFQTYRNYKEKLENVELVPLDGLVERARAVKTEDELELIRISQQLNDKLFEQVLNIIDVDRMTEKELAIEIEYLARKIGADGVSFPPIVATGSHSALPHAKPRDELIRSNTVLLLDFGVIYKGYASDMTRTLWIGSKPPEEFVRIYNIVLEAQERVEDEASVGMTNRQVDAIARNYIDEMGYASKFGHGLGHGIGLEVHEMPYFSQKAPEWKLQGNEVFTVEPGIYLEGRFGVRIEDMVIVKEGLEVITRSTKNLKELTI